MAITQVALAIAGIASGFGGSYAWQQWHSPPPVEAPDLRPDIAALRAELAQQSTTLDAIRVSMLRQEQLGLQQWQERMEAQGRVARLRNDGAAFRQAVPASPR